MNNKYFVKSTDRQMGLRRERQNLPTVVLPN